MEIKQLIEKTKFTKADKEFLIGEGEKYGVEAPANTRCPDCWRDMALQIYAKMPKGEGKHALRGIHGEYGVIHKGKFISNANIDELWDWMMDNDFPMQLVER